MLEAFFETHCAGEAGLPRGLGLSAILSEYVMQGPDSAIRLLPGVYRYHRFVDDIIVFCTPREQNVADELLGCLPEPLKLNTAKSQDISLPQPHGELSDKRTFEYLGYKYSVDLSHARGKARRIRVGIADKKINRIKARLILAARAFALNNDYVLFLARLNFLAGNYKFQKKRPLVSTGRNVVKSGIFYNYRYCGDYQGDRRDAHQMAELRQLDWFLQNSILGRRHTLGQFILSQLKPSQLTRLRTISFAQGHLKVFNSGLTSEQVKKIKSIWKNV